MKVVLQTVTGKLPVVERVFAQAEQYVLQEAPTPMSIWLRARDRVILEKYHVN